MTRKIIIAVPRGRIINACKKILNKTTFAPDPLLFDEKTRKLTFKSKNPNINYIKVRAFDVCTFVAFGAAHIGIAGDDVVQEYDYSEVYAPLNLNIGHCRLSIAAPINLLKNEDPSSWSNIRVATKYPNESDDDKEAIRQHAVAAVNMTQQVKKAMNEQGQSGSADTGNDEPKANTAFVDGIRQFVMDVTSLDVDFIDRINPFGEAYAILAKSMSEESLRQFGNIIAGKKAKFTLEEAKELAVRALKFKKERGRLPEVTSNDPWEKRIAEGMNAYAQMVAEAKQNG